MQVMSSLSPLNRKSRARKADGQPFAPLTTAGHRTKPEHGLTDTASAAARWPRHALSVRSVFRPPIAIPTWRLEARPCRTSSAIPQPTRTVAAMYNHPLTGTRGPYDKMRSKNWARLTLYNLCICRNWSPQVSRGQRRPAGTST